MRGSLHQVIKPVPAIPPDSYAAGTTNGAVIDTRGFAEMLATVQTRVATGTADFKVQHGDESDGSDMADVTGATFTQITSSNDGTLYKGRINVHALKRYVRIVVVVATDVVELSAVVILGAPEKFPVTPVNTVAFNILV